MMCALDWVVNGNPIETMKFASTREVAESEYDKVSTIFSTKFSFEDCLKFCD